MPAMLEDREIAALTVPERLELIGRLWDSCDDSLAIPAEHRRILEARLAAADADPAAAIPLAEALARIGRTP